MNGDSATERHQSIASINALRNEIMVGGLDGLSFSEKQEIIISLSTATKVAHKRFRFASESTVIKTLQ